MIKFIRKIEALMLTAPAAEAAAEIVKADETNDAREQTP